MKTHLFALLALFAPLAASAVPLQLSNSGRINDANGVGLTGPQSLTFSLYAEEAGTTLLWSESHSVDFTDGAYAAVLGVTTPIDEVLLEQYPVYLGLSVNGGPDMLPRYEVVSAPYAILAETAANVVGGVVDVTEIRVNGNPIVDSSGQWTGPAPTPADLGCADGQLMAWNAAAAAWTCATPAEGGVDTFAGTPASTITNPIIAAWNEAYGWGNHSLAGYLTSESDPAFMASAAAAVTAADLASWNAAAGWGDHAAAGYLTTSSQSLVEGWARGVAFDTEEELRAALDAHYTYVAGAGLTLVDNTFAVDATFVQRRVDDSCAVGASIREILADGTVVCEPRYTDAEAKAAAQTGDLAVAGTVSATSFGGSTSFNEDNLLATYPQGVSYQTGRGVNAAADSMCRYGIVQTIRFGDCRARQICYNQNNTVHTRYLASHCVADGPWQPWTQISAL